MARNQAKRSTVFPGDLPGVHNAGGQILGFLWSQQSFLLKVFDIITQKLDLPICVDFGSCHRTITNIFAHEPCLDPGDVEIISQNLGFQFLQPEDHIFQGCGFFQVRSASAAYSKISASWKNLGPQRPEGCTESRFGMMFRRNFE
jgi:hypothetical protein